MHLLATAIMMMLGTGNVSGKVFFLNSYHPGYASSDSIHAGVIRILAKSEVQLQTFHLDRKRRTEPAFVDSITTAALAAIRTFAPDVLIVSDDNAVKEVVVPHFKEGPLPVVFCGVNWSCEQYGLPTPHVTGMLEVLPIDEALRFCKTLNPSAEKLTVISENSLSEAKNSEFLDARYRAWGWTPRYALVDSFPQWKTAFLEANEESDAVYVVTNGAIKGWQHEEARAFVLEHIKKPVFTCDDFMMPFAAFGFTKVAAEQGEWAAKTALKIIGGASPRDLPVTENQLSKRFINNALLERLGLNLDPLIDHFIDHRN